MGGNCFLSIEALNKTASSKSIGPCPAVMDSAFEAKVRRISFPPRPTGAHSRLLGLQGSVNSKTGFHARYSDC